MPIYMKYEGIEGAMTGKYKGWIELESCQFENWRGSTARKEILISKYNDITSVLLFQESARGESKGVVIDFVKSDSPYLTVELKSAIITSYSIHGASFERPVENLHIQFLDVTYKPQPGSK